MVSVTQESVGSIFIIMISSLEFFTSADGLLLEFEW